MLLPLPLLLPFPLLPLPLLLPLPPPLPLLSWPELLSLPPPLLVERLCSLPDLPPLSLAVFLLVSCDPLPDFSLSSAEPSVWPAKVVVPTAGTTATDGVTAIIDGREAAPSTFILVFRSTMALWRGPTLACWPLAKAVTCTRPRSTDTDALDLPTLTWKIVLFTTAAR
ncbi:hypothetical protein F2982_29325 (plasmid) [Rhizobium sp. BG4]|nr:hypothetical protein F2982_29325 [Rhizobium sp. BG4]